MLRITQNSEDSSLVLLSFDIEREAYEAELLTMMMDADKSEDVAMSSKNDRH